MQDAMKGLHVYTSNRLEDLGDRLAQELYSPLSSPLAQETIVVQSKGMERWVSLRLALRLGVCANVSFPFPKAAVHALFRKTLPDLPEEGPFEPETLVFKVMNLLPSCAGRPGFGAVRRYLRDDADGLKRYQLSARIADLLDQYGMYRPKWLLDWESGKENHWQAALWREIVRHEEAPHFARVTRRFLEAAHAGAPIEGLPERISIFGISYLPPLYVRIFGALALHIRVNLFLLNPCREYWGDIVGRREEAGVLEKYGPGRASRETLHLERGNRLLASLGTVGRDFLSLIHAMDGEEAGFEEVPRFEDPGTRTMLSCIQADILNLRESAVEENDAKRTVSEADRSILVQSCHSPMREIEVLRDHLLAWFEEDPTLTPKDVLVMAPDIEPYAPFIRAVLDAGPHRSFSIPFSIADRSAPRERPAMRAFLSLLAIRHGRMGAPELLGILEAAAVYRRFGLSEPDLHVIRRWVEATRIRWGVDAAGRKELGFPELPENTWKAGLDRLLLGYAMPGREDETFQGILPYDAVEGDDAPVLGKLVEFTRRLFSFAEALKEHRTLVGWAEFLSDLADAFLDTSGDAGEELRVLQTVFHELSLKQEQARFHETIPVSVVEQAVIERIGRESSGRRYITGGVTFCSMLPMRSIPFEVICLIGMNHDAYPRQSRPPTFDLMARHPLPGDRSRGKDDRYLFLETLISARKRLYISYVGQDIRDNSVIPPSVLVSELLDVLDEGFEIPGKSLVDHCTTRHRLHGFNPAYFRGDAKLWSFSEEDCRTAEALLGERTHPAAFIESGLKTPPEESETVDIEDLCRFFSNPTRFLLTRRLNVVLDEPPSAAEDDEPFLLADLDAYVLNQTLAAGKLAGRDEGRIRRAVQESGQLPHGRVGDVVYQKMSREADDFVAKVRSHTLEGDPQIVYVQVDIDAFRLTGRIDHVYPDGPIRYRYADLRPRDRMTAWIRHLALGATDPTGPPMATALIGKDATLRFKPVPDSSALLRPILDAYRKGLTAPLPFFPESSWVYADGVSKGKTEEQALKAARDKWNGDDYVRGESQDPYYERTFGGTNPLGADFQTLARTLFGAMLEYLEEVGE